MPFLKQCYAIWRGLDSACHGRIAIRAIRGFRTSGVGPIVSHSPSGYLRGDRGSSQLSTVGHRLAVISKAVFLQLKAEPIIHEVSFWNDVTGSISPDGSTELVAHPVSACMWEAVYHICRQLIHPTLSGPNSRLSVPKAAVGGHWKVSPHSISTRRSSTPETALIVSQGRRRDRIQ